MASAADCGGCGDGHLYVAVVLAIVVKFYVGYVPGTWYQVKGFCADAHRLTTRTITQAYYTILGLTECIRLNKH